ncbi:MAG TPA: RNA polymerase sigma factor SigM [Kineosporiaceae bacterium]|nr:RNA polymerase sigma factor SigM [Kineosporiaceae bacterium]
MTTHPGYPPAADDRARRDQEDRALLRAHVLGDQQAFTELVRRHRDRLWAVALRTLGDREEAADALQDALVSAFRSAGTYRGEAAVTTWLHRVVVNACLDRVRRRKARPTVPLGAIEVPSRGDDHGRTETRLDVQAALATLPEGQRAAIVLVDMQDMSVAEAAIVLGVAEGTVKSRCSRGRTALAQLLRAAAGQNPSAYGGNRARHPHVAGAETARVEGVGGPATTGGAGQ